MSEDRLVPKLRFSGFDDEEWQPHLLGEISDVTKLAGFEFTEYVNYSDEGNIIALRGLNVKNNKLDLTDVKYIDNSDFTKLNRSKLYIGDLLFTYVGTIGEVALISEDDKYYLAPNVCRIRSNEYVNPDLLKFYFNTNIIKKEILKYVTKSSQPALSMENIRKFKIKLPTISEQEKIANFLVSVDNKIELLEKKYESYVNFKKYLMQQIFAQKLRFAEFDDEWKPYKIGDISKTYSGGTPSTSKREYYKGNIPFIKSGEINKEVTEQYITEDAINNSSAKRVQKGDLLLALYGATSGEVAISKINGAINQAVLKIDNDMDNYFQYCYFLMYKDQIIHKYLQGGQGNLSANIIKKLEFKYPSLAEQKKISQFFMSIENKLELYENKIQKFNNFKKGLLQQMFV